MAIRRRWWFYGTPGLKFQVNIAQPSNLPLRALLCANETGLYGLQSNQFLSIAPNGTAFFKGTINTISGLASLAVNPAASQVMLVDGKDGWVYQPAAGTFLILAATGTWWTPGARTVTNVGGYFVSEIPGTGEFGVSNINDATTGSSLSFATAAAYADICIAVDNLQGNLVTFGNIHTEFWQPVGTPSAFPALRTHIQAAANEWGLAAIFSRGHLDQALFFLGKTRQGTRRICRIDGLRGHGDIDGDRCHHQCTGVCVRRRGGAHLAGGCACDVPDHLPDHEPHVCL